jgi:N-acetylglucosaminyldiphosphoundecaprenol N-acetyl-beta-D-mannosaminyltransferase
MVDRRQLFGICFDALRMCAAVERILAWCRNTDNARCRYVVTPNVDHVVQFQERAALRDAYAGASLVLVDGTPIVWASRLFGRSLPERVAGSDLVPALFAAVSSGSSEGQGSTSDAGFREAGPARPPALSVFLLGAGPGIAEEAARRIQAAWPEVAVVGTYSPPLGFEQDDDENRRIIAAIAAAAPDVLIVGLGAPKQEIWTHQHHAELPCKVALCVGATIDFLAGAKKRSPRWMRRVGLEWLHRVITEPRRLARRYARDAWIFPRLIWRQWRC